MSSMNDPRFRCAISCSVAIALLVGCQTSGRMYNALSYTAKGKQAWTSRLLSKLEPSKDAERVGPIDQELALAHSLELQGKTAEAIYTYSTILAKEDRADVHHRLAVMHDKRGNFQASEEHYQEALKVDPKNAELLCDRGFSYLLQGRMEDAQDHLNKAIKREPKLSRAHNNLGLLLAQQGHVDRALVEFAAAGCSHAEARTNLAYALTMAGKVADAEHHLEIARQADVYLLPAGELEDALRRLALGKAPKSNSQQLVTANWPVKSPVGESNEVPQTAAQKRLEPFNQQVVDTLPNNAQYRVASLGQLNDYQSTTFEDTLPTPVDIEPVTIQQPSQPKHAQLQQAVDQLIELPQPVEIGQLIQLQSTAESNRQRVSNRSELVFLQ
ncbi:MAG: tetratricopeptide repeat protein [Planctomycetes bacterium]|nr:tetratricopeptide repeat protein [Planctomycetota bacterium]